MHVRKVFAFLFSILLLSSVTRAQTLIDYPLEDVMEMYAVDSSEVEFGEEVASFYMDSLETLRLEMDLLYGYVESYRFVMDCARCYDAYLYDLVDDYYSDWVYVSENVYWYKWGWVGTRKLKGEKKKYLVPRMELHHGTYPDPCLVASITENYISKEESRTYFEKVKPPKIKKGDIKGSWSIRPNPAFDTDIVEMEFKKGSAFITFDDGELMWTDVTWYADDTFQLWYLTDECEAEVYLTGTVKELNESKMILWFYDDDATYIQEFAKKN